jgi:hypothetical protein
MHRVLVTLVRNPSLADHVRTLYLQWSSLEDKLVDHIPLNYEQDGFDDSDFGIDHFLTYRKTEIRGTPPTPTRKPYPSSKIPEFEEFYQAALQHGLDEKKLQRVKEGSESAMALILLSILPEVRTLYIELPEHPGLFDDCQLLLDVHFPTMLETVHFSFESLYREEPTREGYYTSAMIPFFMIPSIRNVSGEQAFGEGRMSKWVAELFGRSFVEKLALSDATITPANLSTILRVPLSLKSLKFKVDDDEITTRRAFGQALSYVSHSLEFLAIDITKRRDNDNTLIGLLSHFKYLKSLSIGFDDILNIPSPSSIKLADVLPTSLEDLILQEAESSEWKNSDFVEAVRRLLQAKHDRKKVLPNLKRVGMGREREHCRGDLDLGCLVPLAKEVGVLVGKADWHSAHTYVIQEIE